MVRLSEYQNVDEKRDYFDLTVINKENELDLFWKSAKRGTSEGGVGPIWRGMCESKYKHYTSLQRFWFENNCPTTSTK